MKRAAKDALTLPYIVNSIPRTAVADSLGGNSRQLHSDFHSKNCGGGVAGREFETTGRLREARQVDALKKLMSKLHPDVERVFQRALPGEVTSEKEVWFMKAPLGRNLFGDMLS